MIIGRFYLFDENGRTGTTTIRWVAGTAKEERAHRIMCKQTFFIEEVNPYSPDAAKLIEELSESLLAITGNSGAGSFEITDFCVPRALFVIARNQNKEAIGCGAIRPINGSAAEVKRMYAKFKGLGIGTKILNYLESKALDSGFAELWLETRLVNKQAVQFYEKRGYQRIPNYGKYVGNNEAICFKKELA